MSQNPTRVDNRDASITRAEAGVDALLSVLIPLAAAGVVAALALSMPEERRPAVVLLLLLQGVLILLGLSGLMARRGQRWESLGLRPPVPADLARALLALLFVFLVNLLYLAVLALFAPDVMDAHMRGIEEAATALASSAPLIQGSAFPCRHEL